MVSEQRVDGGGVLTHKPTSETRKARKLLRKRARIAEAVLKLYRMRKAREPEQKLTLKRKRRKLRSKLIADKRKKKHA